MDISVTQFRAHCLELIRQVESGGEVVLITRHGKPVARLTPPSTEAAKDPHPWAALRGSGVLHAEPEDSVLEAQAFDALR
jgi:prevent-host-death family protein